MSLQNFMFMVRFGIARCGGVRLGMVRRGRARHGLHDKKKR